MSRGEPEGWDKARVPIWLKKVIRQIGQELYESRVKRKGDLPAPYVDRGKTPDHHVLARALYDFANHRARCTRGPLRRKWIDICQEIAKNARLGAYKEKVPMD